MEWDKDLALQARFDDGRDNGIEFVTLNMISEGESPEKICKLTALFLKRIEELAKNFKNQFKLFEGQNFYGQVI